MYLNFRSWFYDFVTSCNFILTLKLASQLAAITLTLTNRDTVSLNLVVHGSAHWSYASAVANSYQSKQEEMNWLCVNFAA